MRLLTPLPLLALAAATLAVPAAAQVARCVGPTGAVTYTDQKCPSATRQTGELPTLPPSTARPAPPPVASAPAPQPAEVPAGPVLIDARPAQRTEPKPRESDRAVYPPNEYPTGAGYGNSYAGGYGDPSVVYGSPYEPLYGYRRAPPPPRDMRPTLRNCDAGGCNDTLGNRYNNRGQLERYTAPDGRKCRPIGTTVVCN